MEGADDAAAPPLPPATAAPPAQKHDYVLKLIIIGDSACGKSSLLQHFINGKMNAISKHTVGVEFGSRTVAVGGEDEHGGGSLTVIKLQIWDTAGQDRFRSVTRSYYRGAVGCLVVFSLCDRASYEQVPRWLHDARTQAGEQVTIVLVGNKSDLESERAVTVMEASKFAQSEGCAYMETSAVSGDNVEAVFFKLARSILLKIQDGSLDATAFVNPQGTASRGGKVAVFAAGGNGAGDGGGGCSC